MGRTRRRRTAATTTAFVLVTAPLLAVSAVAGACPAGAVTSVAQGWTRIAPPSFGSGPATLTTYAVRPTNPRELYASNGTVIARSADGGCTWANVFEAGVTPSAGAPFTSASATVTSLAAAGSTDVAAIVSDGPRLHVLRSRGGTSWVGGVAQVQADATARDAKLLVAPGVLYLLSGASDATRGSVSRVVHVSVDGGATWSLSPIPVRIAASVPPGTAPAVSDLAVSPADPLSLFVATPAGLLRSTDGGETWRDAGIGGGAPIATVTAARGPRGMTVVAVDNRNYTAYVSTDGGANWSATNVPDTVESAAVNPRQATAVVGSAAGVYQAQLNVVGLSPMWTGRPRLTQVAIDAAPVPVVHACACGDQENAGIWRRADLPAPGNDPFVPPVPPVVIPGTGSEDYKCNGALPSLKKPKEWGSSRIEPDTATLTLAPGQEVTLPYRVLAAPKPFEVYYLTETGAKAEFSICPFETGAVNTTNELIDVRNVRVGLGEYRDYPGERDEEWGDGFTGSRASFAYVRRSTMAVPGAPFLQALPALSWRLGPDAMGATALYQAVTGLGQDVLPAGPSPSDILGGQQANFSPEAYKVVVLVTGKWFNDPSRTPGYAGVPIQRALDALKARDVKVVGVWVNNAGNKQTQNNQRYEGRDDVRRVARETGTVARTKLECNGDGYVDLDPGDPLVCDWLASEASSGNFTSLGDPTLGHEMTRMLLHLRDPQPVSLVASGGAEVVPSVTPAAYDGVDLLKPSTHDFQVTFRCDAGNQAVPVTLSGVAGGRTIAESRVLLQCGRPLPAEQRPAGIVVPPPPPVPPVPNPLPHPAPNPGPGPVPQPAANPAPAGQAQAQAQPVAQGVVVPQPQMEPQLAFQRASNQLQMDEAMSALPDSPRDRLRTARQVALAGGALLLVLCGTLQRSFARSEERRG